MFITIKEMLDVCRDNPDAQVGFAPTGHGSWRGAYNEPCLYVEVGFPASLSEFIPHLEELASGKVFYGYKGGEYTYNEECLLNFEESSRAWSDGATDERVFSDEVFTELLANR